MNRKLHNEEPPEVPLSLRNADVASLIGWMRERFYPYLKRATFQIIEQLNSQVQGVATSVTITGANQTLKLTDPGVPVGGSGSIQTIDPPMIQKGVAADQITARSQAGFTGPIFLMPILGSTWTLVTGGNIMAARTAVPFQLMTLYYDGAFWWPSL